MRVETGGDARSPDADEPIDSDEAENDETDTDEAENDETESNEPNADDFAADLEALLTDEDEVIRRPRRDGDAVPASDPSAEEEVDGGNEPAEEAEATSERDIDDEPDDENEAKPEPVPEAASEEADTALIDADQAEDGFGPQLPTFVRPAIAVLAVCALLGLFAGLQRGTEEVVRRELVYSLDGSVPDGFLREDRRLLTQIVTMQSDAVLGPVAEQHDMTVAELRGRIEIETVELSEVLRLDVMAPDQATALSISNGIVDRYLVVSTEIAPAGDDAALLDQRASTAAELETADTALRALLATDARDARLATTEESLERQIQLAELQIDRLQGLLDDALVSPTAATRVAALQAELTTAEAELTASEAELAEVRVERAELAEEARAEPSLARDIARLEAELTAIDEELAGRKLRPLFADPIRELGEPVFVESSGASSAIGGLAFGLIVGLPIAAVVAVVVRRRQLWRR